MAVSIQYGQCTADPRKLDKSTDFQGDSPVTATIKDNCSIMTPDFIVSASIVDLATCNYLKCTTWSRYYYITDLVTMPGGRVMIRCSEDVLTSNAEQIKQLSLYLDRTQQKVNADKYLNDRRVPAELRRQCITLDFDKTPFTANYGSDTVYVLTVLGGYGHTQSSSAKQQPEQKEVDLDDHK